MRGGPTWASRSCFLGQSGPMTCLSDSLGSSKWLPSLGPPFELAVKARFELWAANFATCACSQFARGRATRCSASDCTAGIASVASWAADDSLRCPAALTTARAGWRPGHLRQLGSLHRASARPFADLSWARVFLLACSECPGLNACCGCSAPTLKAAT